MVADREDAIAVLGGGAPDRLVTRIATGAKRNVAFLFAGGGAQHPDMGRDLYRTEPVFRDAIDRCLALLVERCGVDIRPALYPEPHEATVAAAAMERPSLGLPALFAVQYAQAQLWRSWGVTPTGMIGHSMGEYLAAHLAGVFSLADALRLVHYRGVLFETLPPGAMLSVPMAADDLAPMIPAGLSVAAMNGPASTGVSGACEGIASLRAALEAIEMPSSQLRIAVARIRRCSIPSLPGLRRVSRHDPPRRADAPVRLQPDGDVGSRPPRRRIRATGSRICESRCASTTASHRS